MYLMIDNYDSFVYNLVAYFHELGEDIQVIHNNDVNLDQLKQIVLDKNVEGIIISPGPKAPKDYQCYLEIIQYFAGRVPILGVCLGHQIIGYSFGANVIKGKQPMHGKVTSINHGGANLFKNLIANYDVTRYHSLEIAKEGLPESLQIDAYGTDGVIMAITHRNYPIYGIQFHPEAILTEYGHGLLKNFCNISKEWREKNENSSY